jgi:hypothetical protein
LAHLKKIFATNSSWENYLKTNGSEGGQPRLHLAVCIEPYLSFMLDGKKTVESRFSSVRCSPFHKVSKGDVILLKKAGGPVVGLCRVEAAWFYELDPDTLNDIRRDFSQAICPAGPDFWRSRERASFATLLSISDVERIAPFSVEKRDRRGWVTFDVSPSRKQLWMYD